MFSCVQLSALELDREEADRMAREMVVKHQKLSAENSVSRWPASQDFMVYEHISMRLFFQY